MDTTSLSKRQGEQDPVRPLPANTLVPTEPDAPSRLLVDHRLPRTDTAVADMAAANHMEGAVTDETATPEIPSAVVLDTALMSVVTALAVTAETALEDIALLDATAALGTTARGALRILHMIADKGLLPV